MRPSSEGYVDLTHVLDLRAALVTGRATLLGALKRRETRGSHIRSDFPEIVESPRVNLQCEFTGTGELKLTTELVPAVPESLAEWAEPAAGLEVTGRLVE